MITKDLLTRFPILQQLQACTETLWMNPHLVSTEDALKAAPISDQDVLDAEERLQRFAPYLQVAFPETERSNGIIESVLEPIPRMQRALEPTYDVSLPGRLFMKYDSHLPISGSIKARGGIYEVLKHAEALAIQEGRLDMNDDYSKLLHEDYQAFFSNYSIAVGSTGNLGLSIGIMSAKLGFHVTVHMSADAKAWKKNLLREKGVEVIEYESDYSLAVERGREQAAADPFCHFIDDENSKDLFLGYAVAGLRLKQQFEQKGLTVDAKHPLYVYLPCGVGGGPGGVAFGLKLMFGDHVHCFFAEPTHSPCMLLGLVTDLHDEISVEDIGLDNKTEADGLAVGRPSGFVGSVMKPMLAGAYTVSDETLFALLGQFHETENIFLEPSAVAGLLGPVHLTKAGELEKAVNATHLIWATGGGMVPEEMRKAYLSKAREVRP